MGPCSAKSAIELWTRPTREFLREVIAAQIDWRIQHPRADVDAQLAGLKEILAERGQPNTLESSNYLHENGTNFFLPFRASLHRVYNLLETFREVRPKSRNLVEIQILKGFGNEDSRYLSGNARPLQLLAVPAKSQRRLWQEVSHKAIGY